MDFVFTRRFSMAHRLILGNCDTKCGMIHGHNEFIKVRCRPRTPFIPGMNMSIDFAAAKGRWHKWIDNAVDHALQLGDSDPLVQFFKAYEPHRLSQLLSTPGDPTTEMALLVFARKFHALSGDDLELVSIELEETPTNSVLLEVLGASHTQSFDDQFLLAPIDASQWWDRPDLSINNFSL